MSRKPIIPDDALSSFRNTLAELVSGDPFQNDGDPVGAFMNRLYEEGEQRNRYTLPSKFGK